MDRRLVGCGWIALLLHASLGAAGVLRPPLAPPALPAAVAETSVDLLPDPAPPAEPPPEAPPSIPAAEQPSRVATRARPRPATPTEPARVITTPDAEASAGVAPETLPETRPEPEPAPARRLSLADLGVTGRSAAILAPLPDAPRRVPEDVAGLKGALRAHDVALGLGPGGAVANRLRRFAQDLAPLASEATISVDLSKTGTVDTLWLDECTSSEREWRAMLRAVRVSLADESIVAAGPVRVTLRVTSRSSKRSGSGGMLDFDLSNIGSPTLHTVNIRVLAQTPL
jgi:hypothetical protein